ncbi:MAG: HU family DNA-binding protein [Firmicutes bacterium]|nr:HU family DNA-binding protein [Bacillota bacterium]
MKREDFIKELALKEGITQKKAKQILNDSLEIISKRLNKKEKVQFLGFGSFSVRLTPKKVGRDPRTMKEIPIPQRFKVVFRASPGLLKNSEKINDP